MSLVVLAASGTAWAFTDYVAGKLNLVDAGIDGSHPGPSGAMNILLVGADRREGLSKQEQRELHLGHDPGQRTDTVMLMHVSKNHNNISVVSLPRDSYVPIPGHGHGKINSSYSPKAYPDGGPSLTVKTVQQATGVHVDHYMEINFLGVLKIVDALGGVQICTPKPMVDKASGIHLSAGKHMLNGKQSLQYVRTRHTYADQDLGRMQAQQKFLSALLNKAISTGTLTSPSKMTHFLNATLASIRADSGFSASAIRKLASQMSGVTTDDVAFTTVPIANANYTVPGIGSSVLWDQTASNTLFQKIKKDEPIVKPKKKKKKGDGKASNLTIPPGRIRLSIFNGAGTSGLGSTARRDLLNVGFQVPSIAKNWTTTGLRHTVVRYGPTRSDSARTVQAAIPGSQLKKTPGISDIQVVLGSSYSSAKKVEVSASNADSDGKGPKTASQNLCK